MNLPSFVRDQLDNALGQMQALVWRLLFFTRVSATSADGSADGVEGWPGTEGDPASPQQTVRRMEPWGVHGRPAVGVYALIARVLGGAASGLQVGVWTGQQGRQDLAEGETQLYNSATGCEIWLDKDGNIHINVPAGKDVIVNGGTAKVTRVGDAVDLGSWVHTPASGAGVSPCSLTYQAPGAAAPTTIATVPVAVTGKASGGADHFKG